MYPTPSTVPGTAIASIETASMNAFERNFRFTTRYEIIMESKAVIGAAIKESMNESLNALNPLYRVNTSLNHFPVSGKNLNPQVGNNAPIGTQIYIITTNNAPKE